MKKRKLIIGGCVFLCLLVYGAIYVYKNININPDYEVGEEIDQLNGVAVYYNGGVSHVEGRNTAADGYNIGLKYQCVEFVKRYYYQHLKHKMPDTYGNAKDFFNTALSDGEYNAQRDLIQYTNPSSLAPKVDDLIVFAGNTSNRYGHVAIISKVTPTSIEIIQQNAGPFADTRVVYELSHDNAQWKIENKRVLGWLRKE